MSKSHISKLLKLPITELVNSLSFPDDNIDRHNCVAQICHALIGSISPEIAGEHKLPIERYLGMGEWRPEFDELSAIQRTSQVLGLSKPESEAVVKQVKMVLMRHRVTLNMVQLLLNPLFEAKREDLFRHRLKALTLTENGRFTRPPTTATMAIANNLIPKPDSTWAGRLGLISKHPASPYHGNLLEIVAKNKCYIWSFPPASLSETIGASMDRYDGYDEFIGIGEYDRKRASLGMGFVIIAEPWQRKDQFTGKVHDQYSVYIPHWSYDARRAKLSNDPAVWGLGSIDSKSIYEGRPNATKIKWHLHGGIESLPQIRSCLKCSTLYAERAKALPGMPVSCECKTAVIEAVYKAGSEAYNQGYGDRKREGW